MMVTGDEKEAEAASGTSLTPAEAHAHFFSVGDIVRVTRDVFRLVEIDGSEQLVAVRNESSSAKRPRRDGVGRLTKIDLEKGTASVSYIVGGGRETNIGIAHVSHMDFQPGISNLMVPHLKSESCAAAAAAGNSSTIIATPVKTPSPPPPAPLSSASLKEETGSSAGFVRRSTRRAGISQLRRADVADLLVRLAANDPATSADLRVLRLKNYLLADTNKIVMTEVLKALKGNGVVQVLYIQNFEDAMDDQMLDLLVSVLKTNTRLWALNVGENFKITEMGWKRFAKDLTETAVTHIYAGSEKTVTGALKRQMRDAVRENRKKHSLHNDPKNVDVILQIGQMWWNPKNSKRIRTYLAERSGAAKQCIAGQLVFAKRKGDREYRTGRVLKVSATSPSHCCVLFSDDGDEGAEPIWIDTLQHKIVAGGDFVWVKLESKGGNAWWPGQKFLHDSSFVDMAARRLKGEHCVRVFSPPAGVDCGPNQGVPDFWVHNKETLDFLSNLQIAAEHYARKNIMNAMKLCEQELLASRSAHTAQSNITSPALAKTPSPPPPATSSMPTPALPAKKKKKESSTSKRGAADDKARLPPAKHLRKKIAQVPSPKKKALPSSVLAAMASIRKTKAGSNALPTKRVATDKKKAPSKSRAAICAIEEIICSSTGNGSDPTMLHAADVDAEIRELLVRAGAQAARNALLLLEEHDLTKVANRAEHIAGVIHSQMK